MLHLYFYYKLSYVVPIHSKSEFRGSNGAAKKFELAANLSKNATKWPKNSQKWPKMAQEWSKMTQNGPKMTRTFSANFVDWKGGSANFFAFRMYVWNVVDLVEQLLPWWGIPLEDQLPIMVKEQPFASFLLNSAQSGMRISCRVVRLAS